MVHGNHNVTSPVQNQSGRFDFGQHLPADVAIAFVQYTPERVNPKERLFDRVLLAVRVDCVPSVTLAPVPDVPQSFEKLKVLFGDVRVAAPNHQLIHSARVFGRHD